MPDLSKLVSHSGYPAFKNDKEYTGSFNISGSATAGTNTRTSTVNLDQAPDLCDVILNGRAVPFVGVARNSNGWFKLNNNNTIAVNSNGFLTNFDTFWVITYRISGSSVIFTATYTQTFDGTQNLAATPVNYKIIDYSVF
jgi:hypothetical protein